MVAKSALLGHVPVPIDSEDGHGTLLLVLLPVVGALLGFACVKRAKRGDAHASAQPLSAAALSVPSRGGKLDAPAVNVQRSRGVQRRDIGIPGFIGEMARGEAEAHLLQKAKSNTNSPHIATSFKKMALHLDLRCVLRNIGSQHLRCRGSQPKHVSDPK